MVHPFLVGALPLTIVRYSAAVCSWRFAFHCTFSLLAVFFALALHGTAQCDGV